MILNVDVVNKIATFQKRGGCIVCGNSDYQIRFTFDSEWSEFPTKTARFIANGQFTDVDFTGDYCAVPILYDTTEVEVGVYAGELKTTTSAFIGCYRSILCEVAKPSEENDRSHINEAKEAADRAEAAAKEVFERVEEAVKFSTEKVETATNQAAYRAEMSAIRAEEAAERAELEGGGISTEVDNRLKALEQWMNSETYEPMTASLSVSPTSKEYGDSVTGAKLTFSTSRETSSIKLTLPNGTEVDLSGKTSPYTDNNKYLITSQKKWLLNATGTDERDTPVSKEAQISYQYRVYWGLGTQKDGFDSAFVESLEEQGTTLTTSRGITLTFGGANNQYVYYAIPTDLGTPAFQIGEFSISGGFEAGVKISVDTGFKDSNNNAIKLDYNLYRSSNLLKNDEAFNVYVK